MHDIQFVVAVIQSIKDAPGETCCVDLAEMFLPGHLFSDGVIHPGAYHAVSTSEEFDFSMMRSNSSPPVHNSVMMYRYASSSHTSYILMMFGWFTACSNWISFTSLVRHAVRVIRNYSMLRSRRALRIGLAWLDFSFSNGFHGKRLVPQGISIFTPGPAPALER